jgi:hypothetical protein
MAFSTFMLSVLLIAVDDGKSAWTTTTKTTKVINEDSPPLRAWFDFAALHVTGLVTTAAVTLDPSYSA